jgi:hypothetical protein
MLTREMLDAFWDELEKIGSLMAPASLVRGATTTISQAMRKSVGRLPAPASLVTPSLPAAGVRIAKDMPAQVVAGAQPRVISRRALRPTVEIPALQPAQAIAA